MGNVQLFPVCPILGGMPSTAQLKMAGNVTGLIYLVAVIAVSGSRSHVDRVCVTVTVFSDKGEKGACETCRILVVR